MDAVTHQLPGWVTFLGWLIALVMFLVFYKWTFWLLAMMRPSGSDLLAPNKTNFLFTTPMQSSGMTAIPSNQNVHL